MAAIDIGRTLCAFGSFGWVALVARSGSKLGFKLTGIDSAEAWCRPNGFFAVVCGCRLVTFFVLLMRLVL